MAETDGKAYAALIAGLSTEDAEIKRLMAAVATNEMRPLVLPDESRPKGHEEFDVDRAQAMVESENYQPVVQLGDVWQLGDHRLVCGDCTEDANVALLMAGAKAGAVWTDPPYAIYGSATGVSSSVTDDKMVRPMFERVLRVSALTVKVFGHVYVCSDWRSWPSWWEIAKRTTLEPKNCIIWWKGGGGLGANYANTYEMVGFYVNTPKRQTMTRGERVRHRPIGQPNYVHFSRVSGEERQHNAAKPVGLVRFNIEPSTDKGDVVVDWFVGSGTTVIAAEQIGRVCYAMEIEPRYCDVVIRRWETYTGQTATKAG